MGGPYKKNPKTKTQLINSCDWKIINSYRYQQKPVAHLSTCTTGRFALQRQRRVRSPLLLLTNLFHVIHCHLFLSSFFPSPLLASPPPQQSQAPTRLSPYTSQVPLRNQTGASAKLGSQWLCVWVTACVCEWLLESSSRKKNLVNHRGHALSFNSGQAG